MDANIPIRFDLEEDAIFNSDPICDVARFSSAYAVLQQAVAQRAFPGCAFGLWRNGQLLLNDALGQFTYEIASPTVTPGTIYDVASLTKVVCTTAIAMLLYDRGLLDLEMPLGEMLPGFVIGRDDSRWARAVTIRHLLAHTSGLPGYVPLFQRATSTRAVLRGCLELPIEAEPGTRAVYSDPGFILLGKALETILNEPLATWAHREILLPLGLTSSIFCPAANMRALIPPTEDDELFRQRRIQGEVQDEHAYLLKGAAGHAGLFSNVPDLLRFSSEILQPILFRASTIELFARRQPPPESSRALGWDTPSGESSSGTLFSRNSIGHLGYSGCSLWIDRDAGLAVVLLTNRTWPHRESQQIRQVRPAFHDALLRALRG
ncbi:MAG TPA: serine hydrolase domain-containing protein [Acidobacteriaceae bacterium]